MSLRDWMMDKRLADMAERLERMEGMLRRALAGDDDGQTTTGAASAADNDDGAERANGGSDGQG